MNRSLDLARRPHPDRPDRTRRRLLHGGAGALASLALPGASLAAAPSGDDAVPAPAAREDGVAFWNAWLELWNGELDTAADIVSPDIRVHTALMDGRPDTAVSGIDAFVGWIGQLRSVFDGLAFETTAGPLVDRAPELAGAAPAAKAPDADAASGGLLVAGHWTASGRYAGGMPGATLPAGASVSFVGTDLVRVEAGRASEYWLVTDSLGLLRQLGVG